jgi:hypothetical protein
LAVCACELRCSAIKALQGRRRQLPRRNTGHVSPTLFSHSKKPRTLGQRLVSGSRHQRKSPGQWRCAERLGPGRSHRFGCRSVDGWMVVCVVGKTVVKAATTEVNPASTKQWGWRGQGSGLLPDYCTSKTALRMWAAKPALPPAH